VDRVQDPEAQSGGRVKNRLQFVWWGWRVWRFGPGFQPGSGLTKIYRWSFSIGPLEIRRWA
jgi:hypothetical protein